MQVTEYSENVIIGIDEVVENTFVNITEVNGRDGEQGIDGRIQEIVAGENINVDNTDPARPIISSSGGSSTDVNSQNVSEAIDGFTVATPQTTEYIALGGKKKSLISALITLLQNTFSLTTHNHSGTYQPVGDYATNTALANKVDKVTGKGLSTEDYTTTEKNKLASITEIFTTALKSAYDGAVSWISTNGATLISNSHTHTNKTDVLDKLAWNSQDSTIEFALDANSTLQIGQEEVLRVYNNTGSPLSDGQVVYLSGSSGTRVTVALATNTTEIGSESTIGVVTQPIANNSEGFITTSGLVRGIDTNSFLAGDILYLGVGGALTKVKPIAPAHAVKIGYCVKKAGAADGIILVKVDSGFELSELHDVDTTATKATPIDADSVLLYDSVASLWKRLTWENIKSTLKTYFDTLYATAASLLLKRDKTEIGDAHGFVNPPNASNFTISNTGSSVTVNLLANAGNYKINGTDYVNSGLSKTFTASLGQNFLYITSAGLQASTTVWDILDTTVIPVCTVNWDGTNVRLADELHRSNRNLMEHKKQHDTDGARYVSGFATTFGSSANNTFSSALGTIRDEERYHDIAAKTSAQIAYRNSALTAMIFDAASTTYAKMNALVPRYDNAGTLTDVPNGNYAISWMFATNAKLPTNSEIVFVLGQGTYNSLANAQAAAQPTLSGMSVAEWKLLYRVIYRNVGGALLFVQADDFRLTTTGLAVSGTGATANLVTDYSMTGNGTSVSPFALNDELRTRRAFRFFVQDFMNPNSSTIPAPPNGFYRLAVASGTAAYALGIETYSSSTSLNSGFYHTFGLQGSGVPQIVPLATYYQIDCVASITKPSTKNRIIRIGPGASMSSTPTNGIYFEIADTGAITAKCNNGGVITSTSTGVTPTTGTQYHFRIRPTSTSCDFSIFASDGTLLSNLQITTNIPTSDLAPFAMFLNQGTEVVEIGKLYHLSFIFNAKNIGAIN